MDWVGKGKWKYNREKSIKLYSKQIETIRKHDENCKVALCKETEEVWEKLNLDPSKIRCNCQL